MTSKRVGCSPFLPTTESDSYIERERESESDIQRERERERENKLPREKDSETASFREIERERQREIEHQRATVTTFTDKESDRERESEREREGGQRQRKAEKHIVTETESFTTVFCCDCSTVYPGLLLAITARAQATSSLEKTFSWPFLRVISCLCGNHFTCNLRVTAI